MCAPFSARDPECACFLLSFSIYFVCSDFQSARWLHLHNCICNEQAGLSPVQGPYVPTLPSRPLWAQAPVALGSSLFNGVTPVWEQPGAQDTGRQLSKLAIFFIFYQQSQTTVMGSVAWLDAFLIPPTTILAPITNGLWFKTSSYPLEDLLGWNLVPYMTEGRFGFCTSNWS